LADAVVVVVAIARNAQKLQASPHRKQLKPKEIVFCNCTRIKLQNTKPLGRKNTYDLERKSMEMEWKTRNMQFRFKFLVQNFFLLKISLELISETMKSPEIIES
jgi:hypothetical protein